MTDITPERLEIRARAVYRRHRYSPERLNAEYQALASAYKVGTDTMARFQRQFEQELLGAAQPPEPPPPIDKARGNGQNHTAEPPERELPPAESCDGDPEAQGPRHKLKTATPGMVQEWPEPQPLRRELPPPEPFPTDALGNVLEQAALAMMEVIQSPVAICANSLLAGSALAVQGHADIVIDGRTFPVSSYFATVADSGERKTATDDATLKPHAKHQKAVIWRPNLLERTEEMEARYDNPDNDPRGPWTSGDLSACNYYSEGTYPITCPSGRVIEGPPTGRYWNVSQKKLTELDADKRIWWGEDGDNQPRLKRFLSEVKEGRVPQTIWEYSEVGHTQDAKKELLAILNFASSDEVFITPKPVRLLQRVLELATTENSMLRRRQTG